MKFKTIFLTFILVFFISDGISAKLGRGSSRTSFGSSRGSSGRSHGSLSTSSRTSLGNHGISSSGHSLSPSGGHSLPTSGGHHTGSPSTASQHNKAVNTHFLNAEGGGATRPTQVRPSQSSNLGNHHAPYPVPASTMPNTKPGITYDNRQTSPYKPSAPQQDITKSSAGTLNNQGPGNSNPSWSNPYYKPSVPAQPHSPWNTPHQGAFAPPVSNSYQNTGAQASPIGFKQNVYPPTSSNRFPPTNQAPYPTQHMPSPHVNGNPPYPTHMPFQPGHTSYPTQSMPSSWPHSSPSAYHPTNSMPLGNPYSMHPPTGPYNVPGQVHYPQQPQVLAQPAMQPYVPGQTILMVPERSSGPGFGQMVKEALVFSTINAGVNRLINPHTHTYVESRTTDNTPAPTTHITYNNQYFNTAPGVNGSTNPADMPQATGQPTANVPTGNMPTININMPPATGSVNNYPNGGNVPLSANESPYTSNIPSNTGGSGSSGVARATPGIESRAAGNTESNTANTVADNNVLQYRISDNELYKISEELFRKSTHDVYRRIKLNLQTRVTSPNVTDEAREPLFEVDPEVLEYPTIYATRALYNSYEYDYKKKINRTVETRKIENLLIDIFLNTNEMTTAMQWLADQGFIDPDDFERKDVLRRIWFTMFSGSTCGFERVFASENYDTAIIGVQDWIYFYDRESQKRIDYMGYVDKLDLGNTASLLKLNFQMDGIIRPNATIFVGTLPELEMSLYTICFYARPNNVCPVSLGGTKFNIYTHSFSYFGNEVIDLGLPMF